MIDQTLHRRVCENPFPNVILGDWVNNMVKVELDDCYSLRRVKSIAKMLNSRYSLDGFRIYRSSTRTHSVMNEEGDKVVFQYRTKGYHIVFNREVSALENYSILAWLCLQLKDENLTKWFLMQCIKQTVTLRCGFKGCKNPPREVCRFGNQDKMIAVFEDNRDFVLGFLVEQQAMLAEYRKEGLD